MDEAQQVQAIVKNAQAAADDISLLGHHVAAAHVTALVQLARVLWTRLQPPTPAERPALTVVLPEGHGVE